MMDISCEKTLELLPLLANGSISPADRARVTGHLGKCAGCWEYYSAMRPLFAAAASLLRTDADREHPSDDDLYNLVYRPDQMSPDRKRGAEEHIADCSQCAALVESLRRLARRPSEALDRSTAPFLTELDEYGKTPRTERAGTGRTTALFRRPAILYLAVAALVLLVGIWIVSGTRSIKPLFPPSISGAMVKADLPAMTRSTDNAVPEFVIPAAGSRLRLDYPLQPEAGHRYSFAVCDSAGVATLRQWKEADRVDQTGALAVTVVLAPGNYLFVVYDVVGIDTVVVKQPFRVVLRSE